MNLKTYCGATTIIFGVIFVLQVVRFIFAWPVSIGDVSIPVWVSGILGIIAGVLALIGLELTKRS